MKKTLKYCGLMLGVLLILLGGVMPTLAKDRVKLNKTKVIMYVGDNEKLILNNTSRVDWKSTNKKVATINSNGKIVAIKEGRCRVIATDKNTKKKYYCTINILPKKITLSLDADIPWNKKKGYTLCTYKSIQQYVLQMYGDRLKLSDSYEPEDTSILSVSTIEKDSFHIHRAGKTVLTVNGTSKKYIYQLEVVERALDYDDLTVSEVAADEDDGVYATENMLNVSEVCKKNPEYPGIWAVADRHNTELKTFRNIKLGSSFYDLCKKYGCGGYTTKKNEEKMKYYVQYFVSLNSFNYRLTFEFDNNDRVNSFSIKKI